MGDDGIYIERFMYDEIRVVRPSAMDLRHISRTWKSGDLSRYFKTLRDLLLAGFCLLFACTPATGQFVVTERVQFVVSDRVASGPVKPPSTTGRYLVKFTGDHCPPCKTWDRDELPTIKAAGFTPVIVDSTHGNTWGVTSLPTFWIVDRATGKPVEKITGYTSAETLIEKLNNQQPEAAKPIVATPSVPAPAQKQEHILFSIYNGKPNNSHQNRASLIDHLLNEGIHSGRHTRAQLDGMTDSELNYLHESDHGWNHSQPQPVVRIQQSGCPGGNCPTPTNRAQRRMGLLGGLFR